MFATFCNHWVTFLLVKSQCVCCSIHLLLVEFAFVLLSKFIWVKLCKICWWNLMNPHVNIMIRCCCFRTKNAVEVGMFMVNPLGHSSSGYIVTCHFVVVVVVAVVAGAGAGGGGRGGEMLISWWFPLISYWSKTSKLIKSADCWLRLWWSNRICF